MSGRGARARKAVEKDIKKKEKKQTAQEFATTFTRPPSNSSGWSMSAPTQSTAPAKRSSSQAESITRTESRATQSDSGRSGSSSTARKGSTTYNVKGREKSAPRGRGAGVPTKVPTSDRSATRLDRYDDGASTPTSPLDTRRNHNSSWDGMMAWPGKFKQPQPYYGFERDTDLWMRDGDCLIYFKEETDEDDPRPMLRVHVRELAKANSAFFNHLLRYGRLDEGNQFGDDDILPIPSRSRSGSNATAAPPYMSQNSQSVYSYQLTGSQTSGLQSPPLENPRAGIPPRYGSLTAQSQYLDSQHGSNTNLNHIGYPTPPGSVTPSEKASVAGTSLSNPDADITHEIWIPAPSHLKTEAAQRRHHVATRNFIALLYKKPIVGADFFEMVSELVNVMDNIYEMDRDYDKRYNVERVIRYLSERDLEDVRNSLKHALGLLAWSEQPRVSWEEGYLEAFVHASGMLAQSDFETLQFKRLSMVTRSNLMNAFNAMQLKMLGAEEKLAFFDYSDIWSTTTFPSTSPVHKSYESFRKFLSEFYASYYHTWPPTPKKQGRWLSRNLVRRLQQDFGHVYEYLVNRDVRWNNPETTPDGKWKMISTPGGDDFDPHTGGVNLTEMLVHFDNAHGYLHLPRPYPLLPLFIQPPKAQQPAVKRGLFGMRKSKPAPPPDIQTMEKEQRELELAYGEANNVNKLGTAFKANDLVEALQKYEKQINLTELHGISPLDARIGRWILIYGILQTLSTVSVDVDGLKYNDKIRYFVNPSLKNCPPWNTTRKPMTEGSQERSYCWLAHQKWGGGPRGGIGGVNSFEMEEANDVVSELDGRGLTMDRDFRDKMKISDSEYTPRQEKLSRLRLQDLVEKKIEYLGDNDYLRPEVPRRSPRRMDISPDGRAPSQQSYFDRDILSNYR